MPLFIVPRAPSLAPRLSPGAHSRSGACGTKARFDSTRLTGGLGEFRAKEIVFAQGDLANNVMFITQGGVKLTVVSESGQRAVVGIMGTSDFLGEGCLAGQPTYAATASAIVPTTTIAIAKKDMLRLLHEEPEFADRFIAYTLARHIRVEEDLVNQLFNFTEKRLARTLLLLTHSLARGDPPNTIPEVSQEMLAETIGTTRPRVNFFMNKFKKLGFIQYSKGAIRVKPSLLRVVLHGQVPIGA
jgi:CRP/FNR family cyclic AMP-dependent transcriptional regulator